MIIKLKYVSNLIGDEGLYPKPLPWLVTWDHGYGSWEVFETEEDARAFIDYIRLTDGWRTPKNPWAR